MEENKKTKTLKDIISPEKKNDILINSVKLSKTWSFWETYSSDKEKLSYNDSNKLIFKWNDIITFFQFWNKYPGNDIKNIFFDGNEVKYFFKERYRITSMNIFKEGISPMWEDENNKGGKYFQLDYQVKKEKIEEFCNLANIHWKKLALITMGETLLYADYINGIRFVDKTDFKRGKIIMFRMEIWIRKNLDEDKIRELTKYLGDNFGCEAVIVKSIPI